MPGPKQAVQDILSRAGIRVDGDAPWDIRVHDERLYARVLANKNLGLGEAYMEGWWDCERVDQFVHRLLSSGAARGVRGGLRLLMGYLPALVLNLQNRRRSTVVAERHYDLGNDLFGAFLDPRRQYSCAYFEGTDDLAEAQEAKLRLICDKLGLAPGETLLDIGCGWGGLARFAARRYGVRVVGVNISKRQIEYAREHCRGVDAAILDMDYRDLPRALASNGGGPADKAVSVGMFEHVGPRNHRAFFRAAAKSLKDDGIFLLHTIGSSTTSRWADPWISRYIFPNGKLPSLAQITRASEDLFVIEDVHNLGPHYDTTLMRWLANFRAAWPELSGSYSETFRRMWEYYLQCCAGAFRARDIQLWQIVLTPPGREQPRCRLA